MSLEEYRRKRNFETTPEPKGKRGRRRKKDLRFVVHKHSATNLHYDLRLEFDGVYMSWAVPKGPSLDQAEKRLAVHVEDHPIQYGDFEGVIPEGEYGAGTVMIWDRGVWKPERAPTEAMDAGEIKFELEGEKLKGKWVLVQLKDRDSGKPGRDWLLIKERDEIMRSQNTGDILVEQPLSVVSGRSIDEIAEQPDQVWRMDEARAEDQRRTVRSEMPDVSDLVGASEGPLPTDVTPQLATISALAPDGGDWLHEIKYDGYRFLCRIDDSGVVFLTRNGHDWTNRVPTLATAAGELPLESAILDGEVVFLESSGQTNFQALQNSFRHGQSGSLVYMVFDLLYLDGVDLREVPLESRKATLSAFLSTDRGRLRYSDHIVGNGELFYEHAAKLSLEGIVSKKRLRPYRPGRGIDWLKIKCSRRQEFVIAGYTLPAGMRTGLGALLLGYYEEGELRYAGRVGTGFTEASRDDLRARLDPIVRDESPFAEKLPELEKKGATFVEPELIANVEFTSWTEAGHLRHPTFRGLREDIEPTEVTREGDGTMGDDGSNDEAQADAAREQLENENLEALGDFQLTNPDRLFYPEQGITKLTLAAAYAGIVDWILPHVVNRPLSLVRHPEGYHREGFYQKHRMEGMPDAIRWTILDDEGEDQEVLYIEDVVGLMSLVQMGVLEIHPWGSKIDKPDRPDRVIFDLDPDPGVAWSVILEAARSIHDCLADLGLESFVKTTGGKGLHVVVPMTRRQTWDDVRKFARAVARRVAAETPSRYTLSPSKSERKNKIYIDTARNGRGATAVGAYSTRARAGAPMSVPLFWDELSPGVKSDHFTLTNLRRRVRSIGEDPWSGMDDVRQSITAAMRESLKL